MSGLLHSTVASELDVRRLRVLYKLLAALSQAWGPEDVYRATIRSLLEATSAGRAAILLFEEDGVIRFKDAQGLSSGYRQAVTGHSPWAQGERDACPIVVPDVTCDESVAPFRAAFAAEGIRALVYVPLALDAGVIGQFMLCYDRPYECSTDELEISRTIAYHVALAIEHKRVELARRDSEQRLQAILANASMPIFLKDVQGRYLLINRRFEELFHVTKENVVGRTDFDLFPAGLAEAYQANDRAVLVAGEPLAIEEDAPQDDGLHTYISTKFPLVGPDGRINAVCAIATDITDRKQLQTANLRLAAIVEHSNDAIVAKDLNGIITSWNAAAERIFGYTAEEALGRSVSMLSAPGHQNEMPKILAMIRRGERVEHYETRRRRKDGRIIDVSLTVSPVRNAAGEIVGASKIARDITERKLAEQERALLLAREKEARQTAELLNRVGPRLIARLDVEKLAQEVTDIAAALVDAEAACFVLNILNAKGHCHVVRVLSGEGASPAPGKDCSPSAGTLADGMVRYDDVPCEPEFADAVRLLFGPSAGLLAIRSYLAVPVVARSGEVLGRLGFCHSLPGKFTAAHEEILAGVAAQAAIAIDNARLFEQAQWTQAALKKSNEELSRANKDLEVFAYSACHDLKDPLRTIAISAQFIERNCGHRLQNEDSAFLSRILAAADRMTTLINDLLCYTRAAKHEDDPPTCIDAGQVLAEVLDSLRGPIEEARGSVVSENLPSVTMHKSCLAQLFQNLISNALKYRRAEPPQIRIAAEVQDGRHVFSVSDNGIGIAPQFSHQIFGLFKRLHRPDQYPGSGMGLAICQRVVEQYGGRIWLQASELDKGSTFCFTVPRNP